jgi:hypothetical protein
VFTAAIFLGVVSVESKSDNGVNGFVDENATFCWVVVVLCCLFV